MQYWAPFHRTFHQWQFVIHWLLPWQQCFIANKNQECHFIDAKFYETPPDESDKQYYFIIIRLLSFVKRRKPNYCFVRYVLIAKKKILSTSSETISVWTNFTIRWLAEIPFAPNWALPNCFSFFFFFFFFIHYIITKAWYCKHCKSLHTSIWLL